MVDKIFYNLITKVIIFCGAFYLVIGLNCEISAAISENSNIKTNRRVTFAVNLIKNTHNLIFIVIFCFLPDEDGLFRRRNVVFIFCNFKFY